MMDGFQLTEEIRVREKERGCHAPVVGVTAYAPSTDAVNWERVGMDNFLTKPVSPRAMIEKADLWLNRKKQAVA